MARTPLSPGRASEKRSTCARRYRAWRYPEQSVGTASPSSRGLLTPRVLRAAARTTSTPSAPQPDTRLRQRRNPMIRLFVLSALLAFASAIHAQPAKSVPELAALDRIYPTLDALYQDLHRNPELSKHEDRTAAKMAARLREVGFEVTEHVGGTGIVGVLRNGNGPTVLVRTDMDALPLKETTGLPYASAVTTKNQPGEVTPVTHACGHDIHMASWVGAATLLSGLKDQWHGTLVFIGQPAEETVSGANAMVKDGLFTRFPKPDFVVGLHDTNMIPAGRVGLVSGPASAASNAVDITFYGKSGHGAAPHRAIDPIVIAARTVTALQTIVARENNPFDAAVVTVGTFHGGTKRNIIPD